MAFRFDELKRGCRARARAKERERREEIKQETNVIIPNMDNLDLFELLV